MYWTYCLLVWSFTYEHNQKIIISECSFFLLLEDTWYWTSTPDRTICEVSNSKVFITNKNHPERRRRCWSCTLAGLSRKLPGIAPFWEDASAAIFLVSYFRLNGRRSLAESCQDVAKTWLSFFFFLTSSEKSHIQGPKIVHRIPLICILFNEFNVFSIFSQKFVEIIEIR